MRSNASVNSHLKLARTMRSRCLDFEQCGTFECLPDSTGTRQNSAGSRQGHLLLFEWKVPPKKKAGYV